MGFPQKRQNSVILRVSCVLLREAPHILQNVSRGSLSTPQVGQAEVFWALWFTGGEDGTVTMSAGEGTGAGAGIGAGAGLAAGAGRVILVPHSMQNMLSVGFSVPQLVQRMDYLSKVAIVSRRRFSVVHPRKHLYIGATGRFDTMRGYCLSLKNATQSWRFLLIFFAFAGCSATVRPAEFREFPLTVRPGSLLGPFVGTVRDADTKYAVQGAQVVVTWDLTRDGRSVRTFERATTTDVNGAYAVPALRATPSWTRQGTLTGVRVVVFHPDYQPYSSLAQPFTESVREAGEGAVLLDAAAPSPGASEFVQLDNLVLLRKVASGQEANRRVLPVLGVESVQGRLQEEYYRAAVELAGQGEWVLEAGKILMPEHVQEILEREDVPRLIREEARPDLSGYTMLFELDRTVVTVRAASMLASTVDARLASMLQDVEHRSRMSLGPEFDTDLWMFTHGGVRYGVCGLPRDGLILLIGCTEDACRPRTLRLMMRKAVSRRSEVFFMEPGTAGGRHIKRSASPHGMALRLADAVELARILTHPGLHTWIQSVYSLPLGLYEPLTVRRAQWLREELDQLPSTLAVRPDGEGKIRALGLLLDGSILQLTAGRTASPAPTPEQLRLWFHAAAQAATPELRAQLLAHALFHLGRWIVAEDPSRGPRSRLSSLVGMLSSTGTGGAGQGRIFFEDAGGRRTPVDPAAPQGPPSVAGKLILIWSAGRISALPWPVKPELEAQYPGVLLNRAP